MSDAVLAQPSRARVFRMLRELQRPAGTEELAELLGLHPNGVRVHLERIGRELAAECPTGTPEERMHQALATLGFRPRRSLGGHGELHYTLANCPYRDAVRQNQPVVCALHRGLTRGLLDGTSPDTELTAFIPRAPDVAGCLIALEGPLAVEAGSRGRE